MSDTHDAPAPFRAQTIELFFDLVFVFTITQIAHLVGHAHGAHDLLFAFAVLMLIWWMYSGYIWLTNHAHTPKAMRLVLIVAAAAFLVMALAVPESATPGGRLVFGLAYLFIIILHFAAFVSQGGAEAARAMLRVVPFNIASAALVIVAGMIDAEWSWILLLAPLLIYGIVIAINTGGFSLNAGHFAERHGLVLIIVLGETIISVGTGLEGRHVDLAVIVDLALSVALIAALWWSYFDADDIKGEHAMVNAPDRQRSRMALVGYGASHLLMIAGLILIAVGLKAAIATTAEVHGPESFLVWGAAVYLLGDTLFRSMTHIRPLAVRAGMGCLLALIGLIGMPVHGTWLIGMTFLILLAALLVEARLSTADGLTGH